MLLEAGASADQKSGNGSTPLDVASRAEQHACVELLSNVLREAAAREARRRALSFAASVKFNPNHLLIM